MLIHSLLRHQKAPLLTVNIPKTTTYLENAQLGRSSLETVRLKRCIDSCLGPLMLKLFQLHISMA